jgi:hypothetical protein
VRVERLQRLCDFVFARMVAAGTEFLLQRDETKRGSCRVGYAASIRTMQEAADVM